MSPRATRSTVLSMATTILDVGDATGRMVTGLSRGTTYYYRVRPYDSDWTRPLFRNCAATTVATTGLTIHATFDSSITGNPNSAAIQATINRAISIYESLFSDPITIRDSVPLFDDCSRTAILCRRIALRKVTTVYTRLLEYLHQRIASGCDEPATTMSRTRVCQALHYPRILRQRAQTGGPWD